MGVLTAITTHLDAASVKRQLAYLHELAPDARFVVCHGGSREDFEALDVEGAVFVEDPGLRAGLYGQSQQALRVVYDAHVRADPSVDFVYMVEFDHLILRPDFERQLTELADRTNADLLAKNAAPRNATNWSHLLRYLGDARLDRFFERVSRRDDPAVRWGCLGNGMLLRRDAAGAVCEVDDAPDAYVELFVPTLVYHLGFDVVNVDEHSDIYMNVRWRPEFTPEEVAALKRQGATFVHPFKGAL